MAKVCTYPSFKRINKDKTQQVAGPNKNFDIVFFLYFSVRRFFFRRKAFLHFNSLIAYLSLIKSPLSNKALSLI